jgi:hypothetical protein
MLQRKKNQNNFDTFLKLFGKKNPENKEILYTLFKKAQTEKDNE